MVLTSQRPAWRSYFRSRLLSRLHLVTGGSYTAPATTTSLTCSSMGASVANRETYVPHSIDHHSLHAFLQGLQAVLFDERRLKPVPGRISPRAQ